MSISITDDAAKAEAVEHLGRIGANRMRGPDIVQLFVELGMEPQQGSYDNREQTACCVIGALAYKHIGGRAGRFSGDRIFEETGLPMAYQDGLIRGWDWTLRPDNDLSDGADGYRRWAATGQCDPVELGLYLLGIDDGRAGWEMMQHVAG